MPYEVLTDYGSSPVKLVLFGIINLVLTSYMLIFLMNTPEKIGFLVLLIITFLIQTFTKLRLPKTLGSAIFIVMISMSSYLGYLYYYHR